MRIDLVMVFELALYKPYLVKSASAPRQRHVSLLDSKKIFGSQ
jgi:hypothetical protein